MATREFWIQIENRAWDAAPSNVDRLSGRTQLEITGKPPEVKILLSPEAGVRREVTMFRPLQDALILRRYTENWEAPDDRRVNPWDLNEPDPTDNGTMGTIPGATIECNVGDKVIIHFRNKDFREGRDVKARAHSLHPHGIAFSPVYDGGYPVSPDDPTQPIPEAEAEAWAGVGGTGFKKGDRVPPGGTFTYIWDTLSWPTTAGVWFYHDHSICDVENITLGAIGFLVIHNPEDPDDVIEQDLPGGQPNGPLVVDGKYVDPPKRAQYLQLFHELPGGIGTTINGRKYLGNAPTLIGGTDTKMRFGLAAMNILAFHTFHIHGHRWVIPGPQGSTPDEIQRSPQVQAVSQFEDTKIFGPANAFSFTINQGSFMGSVKPPEAPGLGEWLMHCHVLGHMDPGGMMGSLLLVQAGEEAVPLSTGEACPEEELPPADVTIGNDFFSPANVTIVAGQTVTWRNTGALHTVSSNRSSGQNFMCTPVSTEEFDSGILRTGDTFSHTFNTPGTFAYHCEVHGCAMAGTMTVNEQGGCFIATAAYGSEMAPTVQFLRDFRDDVVLKSKHRRGFEELLEIYYSFSPSVAEKMNENEVFRRFMKYAVVWPIVLLIKGIVRVSRLVL